MSKLKLTLAKLFYPVALYWWPFWSGIYRWLYHRKYRDVTLDICLTPQQATEKMEKLTWSRDDARALWDAVGSPRWVQHCLNILNKAGKQPAGPLDCDDYSVWAASCIHPKFDPKIFTFSWLSHRGELKGHAVCWTRNKDGRFFHVGNWGIRGPYANLREVCSVMLTLNNSNTPIGWALYNKELKLINWGRELPSKKIW
jgi:hypothetical protein